MTIHLEYELHEAKRELEQLRNEAWYFSALRAIGAEVKRMGNCGCTVVMADGTMVHLRIDVPDPWAKPTEVKP